jgi:zinc protease
METVEGQANLIADWQALGDWRLADDYLRRAFAVTPAQLHEVAQRYLDPDALTMLVYRPRGAAPFAADADAARERVFGGAAAAADVAGVSAQHAAGPAAAPPRARPARLAPSRVEDGVHMYAVDDGGARIIVKPRRSAPLVSLALACRGGLLSEDDSTAGITGLMARTSVKGTRTRTGARLAEETESLGASLSPGAGLDTVDWTMSAPARHFERGLELLLDAALEPAFRPDDVERELYRRRTHRCDRWPARKRCDLELHHPQPGRRQHRAGRCQ